MARQKSNGPKKPRANHARRETKSSDYFLQPGKRGTVTVLRKPCGNRAIPKVCGVMPSRAHAKALVVQLEKAESVVSDLFLEATDDGIEALDAILVACCDDVMKRMPTASEGGGGRRGGSPKFRRRSGGRAVEGDRAARDDAHDAGVAGDPPFRAASGE